MNQRAAITPLPFKPTADLGLHGPDLLEQFAERYANNGFEIEADVLQRCAKEWRGERDTGEVQAPPAAERAPDGTIVCEMVETDFRTGNIQVRAIGKFRVGAGRYWLMPLVQS